MVLLRSSLLFFLCLVGGVGHGQEVGLEESATPNVIVIVSDGFGLYEYAKKNQLGEKRGTAEWYKTETPHLDALRKRSVAFENFYATPESAPSCAAIQTGRYPYRTGVMHSLAAGSMMAEDEVTLAEILSAAGYNTGAYGRWQLGDHYPMRASDQGYQDSLVNVAARNEGAADSRNVILYRNNREVEMKGKHAGIYTDVMLRYVTTSRDHELPFFCYLAYDSLQTGAGNQAPDPQTVEEQLRELDENIGKIIEKLTELEVMERTLILCTSDKGLAAVVGGEKEREQRGTVSESGVRAPLWLTWPEEYSTPANSSERLASHVDIVPTILEACQVGSVNALELDGKNVLSELKRRADLPSKKEDWLVTQLNNENTPVKYTNFLVREGAWKLMNPHRAEANKPGSKGALRLYNLKDDPEEKVDLAKSAPEKLAKLLDYYETWFSSVTRTRAGQAGRPHIWLNRKSENPVVLTQNDFVQEGKYESIPYYWKLDFQHGSRVDISIEKLDHEDSDIETCRMSLRESSWEQPVSKGVTNLRFETLNVVRGKQDLRIEFFDSSGQRVDAEHRVRLVHR